MTYNGDKATEKTKKKERDSLQELIAIADKAKRKRGRFILYLVLSCMLLEIVVLIMLFAIMVIPPPWLTLESWKAVLSLFGVLLAGIALMISIFSIYTQMADSLEKRSIEEEFDRLSKNNVNEDRRILLRALITMKIKQPKVSLIKLCELYPAIFEDETEIVKKMYD